MIIRKSASCRQVRTDFLYGTLPFAIRMKLPHCWAYVCLIARFLH
jgi:hypothetical protein